MRGGVNGSSWERAPDACWMTVVLLSCVSSSWSSAVAGEDAGGQAVIGTPTSVAIGPENPPLRGRHSTRQMIATGRYADGSVRDLTRLLAWTSLEPGVATVSDRGQVFPRGNGTAAIVARHGSIELSAVVKVQQMDQPASVSFRRDVIPAFSQAGCNTGACHGTPTGKGGFRLSLGDGKGGRESFSGTERVGTDTVTGVFFRAPEPPFGAGTETGTGVFFRDGNGDGSLFQGSGAALRGRPRGRRVDSRPKLWTIRSHHGSLLWGWEAIRGRAVPLSSSVPFSPPSPFLRPAVS